MATGDMTDCVAVGLRLSRRDPSRATDAADGLLHANDCHRSLLTDGTPWSFLTVTGQVQLTAGTQRYTFASLATVLGATNGIERILAMVDDTDGLRPMKGVDWPEFEAIAYSSVDDPTNTPMLFTQVGLGSSAPSVLFWPVPDRAINVGIVARLAVADLLGTAFPLLPAAYARPILSSYVAARMWEQHAGGEAQNMALGQQQRHEGLVRRLIDAYGSAREEDILFAEPTQWDAYPGGPWG